MLQELLPVTLPEAIAGVPVMPAAEATTHVPAFNVNRKEVADMSDDQYDEHIKRLRAEPWAASINIADAKLLGDAK